MLAESQTTSEIAKAAGSLFALLGLIMTFVIAWYRRKDRLSSETRDQKIDDMADNIDVLAKRYTDNVSHEQAGVLLGQALDLAEFTIRCWLCKYVTAKKPQMTSGQWNFKAVTDASYIKVRGRLQAFKFQNDPLSDLVPKAAFDALYEDLVTTLPTFDTKDGVSRYLTNKIDHIRQEAQEALQHD